MFGEDFIERHAPALFKPLNLGFNVATVSMARAVLPRGWRVEDCYLSAPSNLPELNRAMREEGMVVWSGGSDETIYADKEVNYAARAWHDAVHWHHQLPFTVAGEAATAYVQIAQLLNRYGHDDEVEEFAALILTEVIGQQIYSIQHGDFPDDQRTFTECNLDCWRGLAGRVCIALGEEPLDRYALDLAGIHFGKPA